MEIDEIVLRSDRCCKPPMDKEKMQMIFTFVEVLSAEIMGFGLSYLIILAMAGCFR